MESKLELIAVQDRYYVNNVNSLIVKFFIKNISTDDVTILLKNKRLNNIEGIIVDNQGEKIVGEEHMRILKNKDVKLKSTEKTLRPENSLEIGTWLINLDKNYAQGLGQKWKNLEEYRGKMIKIMAKYKEQEIEVDVKIPS